METIGFRSGFVAVIGRPNVGKSTLINRLLQQKVAAVSPRPQTTRRRQLGILTLPEAQIIFVDTPGLHNPVHKLGEFMNQEALDALQDADVILWLVDLSQSPTPEDRLIAERLKSQANLPPLLMLLNKADACQPDWIEKHTAAFAALFPNGLIFQISATTGQGVEQIVQEIIKRLPQGPAFYDPDQVTDYFERDIAAELIREAALLHLRDEVPHAIAVRIDEYTEREEDRAYIAATIFVERESHKGIVIGQKGEMLKKIGSTARLSIEEMSSRKIFLELRVKVNKNWRNSPDALRLLGYVRSKDE